MHIIFPSNILQHTQKLNINFPSNHSFFKKIKIIEQLTSFLLTSQLTEQS
eukprot:m.274446 g.274446  ORF g.274446 m.274446 type:complete len:50 (-) comp16288_c1_seq9:43-192(-)